MDTKTVLVFAGGDGVELGGQLPDADLVIAADSGLDLANLLGVEVDLLIGDLDSVSPEGLAAAREAGMEIEEHPAEKDATDLELSLAAAVRRGAARIVVVGGGGGRIDHFLANAMLLASPGWAEIDVEWLVDAAHIIAIRHEATIDGAPGDVLTLLAIGEPADGVTTEGLRYELTNDVLLASSTRGVSNEFVEGSVAIRVRNGVLLAIHRPST